MVDISMSFDKSREGINSKKIIHLFRVLFSKKATEILGAHKKFTDINFDSLWESGKRGIILDIDECVAPHHGMILYENMQLIQHLKQMGWEIVIFSNMKKTDRYSELEQIGIPVCVSQFAKPDPKGFLDAQSLFIRTLTTKEIVIIGDNYLTDGGSIQAGIDFIKIEPIETGDTKQSIGRIGQKIMRDMVDTVAFLRGNLNYK